MTKLKLRVEPGNSGGFTTNSPISYMQEAVHLVILVQV